MGKGGGRRGRGGQREGEGKGERGEGRRTRLLLALVIWPFTTHSFRDGAPFLLLLETPPTVGRSLRCFYILHRNVY